MPCQFIKGILKCNCGIQIIIIDNNAQEKSGDFSSPSFLLKDNNIRKIPGQARNDNVRLSEMKIYLTAAQEIPASQSIALDYQDQILF